MNREQRRHPNATEGSEPPGYRDPKQQPAEELARPDGTQDDFSVRAKSTGHKKKTADKWNQ
jgi:hypothetical protein